MPEFSFPIWFPWLMGALTGGLAGASLTLFVNWRKAEGDAKRAQLVQTNALKQELTHALWLIEYNHGRIRSEGIPHKGLTVISTLNVERVLFGATSSAPLKPEVLNRLHDYLQQAVYHNSLVAEMASLIPYTFASRDADTRIKDYMAEIKAICTPEATYRQNDPEPSLRARAKRLIEDLDALEL